MKYPIFLDTKSGFEYVLIGVTAPLPEPNKCGQHKASGVLLQKLRGSTVLNGLPVYIPMQSFMSAESKPDTPMFQYAGNLPSTDLLEAEIKGGLGYTYRSIIDEILTAKAEGSKLRIAEPAPCVIGGCYRHYKNGKMYQLLCLAKDHTNDSDTDVVVYSSVEDPTSIWTRHYEEFFECVEWDGIKVPRFAFCYVS